MQRSISAFILGLIGSIFSLFWGFVCGAIGDIISAATTEITVIRVLGWAAFIGAIVGIVGAALCIKKAKKGAICLTVATVACGALQLYIFFNDVRTNVNLISLLIFVLLIPAILLAVATVMAYCAKPLPSTISPASSASENIAPAEKQESVLSLEERLQTLKKLHEDGLIDDEEYAKGKQDAINKHL